MEPAEDCFVGGDKRRFVAVATGQVLWGNDRNSISGFGFYQQNLTVIVSKIGALDNLGNERPKFEGLVGSLVVEYKIDATDFFILGDKKQWFGKIWGCSVLAKPLTEPTDDLFSELFWDAEIFRKSK